MSQQPADNSTNYAIARIDIAIQRTHGWQVRLQRRGVKYAKFFSDSSYGGSDGSLATAKLWRDKLLVKLDDSVQNQARICTRSTRNSSGVVGVSKISVKSSNGVVYQFWQATWSPEPGKRCCVKFSVRRYGDNEAFELAVEARLNATN